MGVALAGECALQVELAGCRGSRHDTRETSVVNAFGQPIGAPLPGWTPPAAPSRTPMTGRYSRLEPIGEQFATELFAAASHDEDGRTWTYLPYGPPANEHEYRRWLVATCLGDDPLFFAIVDAATGRVVSQTSYLNIILAQG